LVDLQNSKRTHNPDSRAPHSARAYSSHHSIPISQATNTPFLPDQRGCDAVNNRIAGSFEHAIRKGNLAIDASPACTNSTRPIQQLKRVGSYSRFTALKPSVGDSERHGLKPRHPIPPKMDAESGITPSIIREHLHRLSEMFPCVILGCIRMLYK